MKNKIILNVIIVISIILFSCTKNNPTNTDYNYNSKAVITGYDMGMCICCGGLILSFKEDATAYSVIRIRNFPEKTGISDTSKFPINVWIDWKFDSLGCGNYKFINISKISRR